MLKRDIDKLLPALMLGPRYYHEVSGVQFGDLGLIALKIEALGVEAWLAGLREDLVSKTYTGLIRCGG